MDILLLAPAVTIFPSKQQIAYTGPSVKIWCIHLHCTASDTSGVESASDAVGATSLKSACELIPLIAGGENLQTQNLPSTDPSVYIN